MLFNSLSFIFLFLPATVFLYFFINQSFSNGKAQIFIIIASLFFYGYWNINYLFLITFSVVVNFTIATSLTRIQRKKEVLLLGILFNLSLLFYYKYTNFLITNLNLLLPDPLPNTPIFLPLAISFFTFQQIAYLVDVYSQRTVNYNFKSYFLFVVFFPQLIAGPIVHHREIIPSILKKKNQILNWKNINLGLSIFAIGLSKKVLIADLLAIKVNEGFSNISSLSILDAWVTSFSYTFQLYFDFSGYADMAIGIGLLFNIRLPANFDSPYKARNIQDFWRRWHITLSRWLKDYVYIPLGGNKISLTFTLRNVFLTALISGLWHGAGWNFLIWGALHGIALVLHRLLQYTRFKVNNTLSQLVTFIFINFTWVIFRAENSQDGYQFYKKMLNINEFHLYDLNLLKLSSFLKMDFLWIAGLIICFFITTFYTNTNNLIKGSLLKTVLLLFLAINFISKHSEFLYFRF